MEEELLREAAHSANTVSLTSLLDSGISPNAANRTNGWTSLHWASKENHLQIARLLLAYGGNPLILNHKGQSPIDVAKTPQMRELLQKAVLPMDTQENLQNLYPASLGFSMVESNQGSMPLNQETHASAPAVSTPSAPAPAPISEATLPPLTQVLSLLTDELSGCSLRHLISTLRITPSDDSRASQIKEIHAYVTRIAKGEDRQVRQAQKRSHAESL